MTTDVKSLAARAEEMGKAALAEVEKCADLQGLEQLRVKYLGKKGEFSGLARKVKDIPADERPEFGKVANRIKTEFGDALDARKAQLSEGSRARQLETEKLDVTLPGRPALRGHLHPITSILREIEDIFVSMGFEIESGPDIEDEFHNFEALNIQEDHPARDMHDTFYMKGGGLMRTHTSPVQIRTMRNRQPPLAIICPGRVYRCDADLTHSPMFYQVEGLLVDTKVQFSDLKGVLITFLNRIFGEEMTHRFRPSYFPFTEPSAEVDILWKSEGREPAWLEVLGCGMVHPNVLRSGGFDPEKVSGFAFGLGVERFAMLKYGIPNIRLFYENDLRFLRQF